MREHSKNASVVADYLNKHEKVARVIHPSNQSGEEKRRAQQYHTRGYGGLVGNEIIGGKVAGQTYIEAMKQI